MKNLKALADSPRARDLIFAFALVLVSIPPMAVPSAYLDSSWITGVTWARILGLNFGSDIAFTYGPWAFLDFGPIFSGPMLLAHVIAYASAGILVLFVARFLVNQWLPPLQATLFVSLVLAPVLTIGSHFSNRTLILALLCALGLTLGNLTASRFLLPALAVMASLAVEVKFSNGVLAASTVVLAALLPAGTALARLKRFAIVASTGALSAVLWWLLAGQDLRDAFTWFRASLELTRGYSDAMALEGPFGGAQYVVFTLIVALLIWQLAGVLKGNPSRVALILLSSWTVFIALRLGFTRHDLGHTFQSFTLLAVLALSLGVAAYYGRAVLTTIAAVSAVLAAAGSTYFYVIDPGRLATGAQNTLTTFVSREYRAEKVDRARDEIQGYFALEPEVLEAIGSRTVHVDPIDVNLAWAYQLQWKPVPVLQSYSAYTPFLDELNADSLRSPGGPEVVLRGVTYAIDQRNALWESPQYMKELVCNFGVATQSERWLVLEKIADRCGAERDLSTEHFAPGETIRVPRASQSDTMIVAFVELDGDPLNALAATVFKPASRVLIGADEKTFHVPRLNSAGPLIVQVPQSARWGSQFGGEYSLDSMTFNSAGSVTFVAVVVDE